MSNLLLQWTRQERILLMPPEFGMRLSQQGWGCVGEAWAVVGFVSNPCVSHAGGRQAPFSAFLMGCSHTSSPGCPSGYWDPHWWNVYRGKRDLFSVKIPPFHRVWCPLCWNVTSLPSEGGTAQLARCAAGVGWPWISLGLVTSPETTQTLSLPSHGVENTSIPGLRDLGGGQWLCYLYPLIWGLCSCICTAESLWGRERIKLN